MDEAEGADIAVVARLEPARVIVLAAVDRDVLDALAERAVGENVGRVGVGKDERAVRGGRAERLDQLVGQIGRQRARPAAIDHQPLRAVRQLERRVSRREPCAAIFGGGGGAASMTRIVPSADSR